MTVVWLYAFLTLVQSKTCAKHLTTWMLRQDTTRKCIFAARGVLLRVFVCRAKVYVVARTLFRFISAGPDDTKYIRHLICQSHNLFHTTK